MAHNPNATKEQMRVLGLFEEGKEYTAFELGAMLMTLRALVRLGRIKSKGWDQPGCHYRIESSIKWYLVKRKDP